MEIHVQKLVVVGRGAVYNDEETGQDKFADYMGAVYPMCMNPKTTIFFQHKDIDKIVFEEYSDEDEIRFLEIYTQWKNN